MATFLYLVWILVEVFENFVGEDLFPFHCRCFFRVKLEILKQKV